jgi:hypothetical protein
MMPRMVFSSFLPSFHGFAIVFAAFKQRSRIVFAAFQPAFSKWFNVGIAPSMLNLCLKK